MKPLNNAGKFDMNPWTQKSVRLAQRGNYLDRLFEIYPVLENPKRDILREDEVFLRRAFVSQNNKQLISKLLDLKLFPLKDSYVAFLKADRSALDRNPETVDRLAGALYEMGYDEMIERCTAPIEANRQMGPMFKRWVSKGTLGAAIARDEREFMASESNCIFNATDREMQIFAERYFGYERDKGVDFIARYNGKYVIGESKFLTAYGGHQNEQFKDAIGLLDLNFENKRVDNEIIPIAILDGVVYIEGGDSFYKHLLDHPKHTIISALLLKDFLDSV